MTPFKPNSYIRKTKIIEAVQVTMGGSREIAFWCNGTNPRGTSVVLETRSHHPEEALPGDWIILDDGIWEIMTNECFVKEFELNKTESVDDSFRRIDEVVGEGAEEKILPTETKSVPLKFLGVVIGRVEVYGEEVYVILSKFMTPEFKESIRKKEIEYFTLGNDSLHVSYKTS